MNKSSWYNSKNDFEISLQMDQSDCGVACLLSVIQYYGGSHTLENLRRLSGTTISGTTLLGLCQAARQTGFDADGCEADMPSLIAHESPCILHVIMEGNLQHYIVCIGTTEKEGALKFIIGDPAKGIGYLSRDELERIWKSKTCLVLTPNTYFQKASDTNNAKRRWIKELIKEDFPILSIAVVIGIAVAALGVVMAIFSQRLIDNILPKKNFVKLNLGIALVLILLIVKEGLSVLRQYFLLRQSREFSTRIIDFFYRHLLLLPKPFFDTRKIGELTARLNDTSRIQRVISQLAGNVIIDILVAITSTIFIFTYSWTIGLACVVAIPVFYLLVYLNSKKIAAGQQAIMSNYALAEANYISTLQGIEPIKNYNKQPLFSVSNIGIYKQYQDKLFSLGTIQMRLSFFANTFGASFITVILLFCSYQVLGSHLKVGELIAILGMCSSLLPSIANLALISIPVSEARIAFNRMFEFTALEKEPGTGNNHPFLFQALEVNNLSFRFAGRSQLLKDISFTVSVGEIVAVMGENGSGKSTLTHLLQKNYNAESGEIIINKNISFNNVPLHDWRGVIGVVPQHIHIFNATVLENIAFEDAATKANQVLQFLEACGFMPFMNSLPQSFLTLVGEEGVNLSGGQKQVIALARALYHQPQLLVLDEATSAMDRNTEQFMLQLLNRMRQKMGIIFITHRLHILKSICDRIYILDNGVISSAGNHEQLLKGSNLYSRYWSDLVQ